MRRLLTNIAWLLPGLVLIIAGLSKVSTIGDFGAAIADEVPMPREGGTASAVVIVAAELLSGVGFFFRRTRRISAALSALLFLLFVSVILRKIIGGGEFQCACFGILGLQLPLVPHLVLDVGLMILALVVILSGVPDHGFHVRKSFSRRFQTPFRIAMAACVLLVTWAFLPAFHHPAAVAPPEEKQVQLDIAFPVRVTAVRRSTLIKGIRASGLLRPVRMVELVPRVSGQIVAAYAYEGKEVRKGEVLATIDKSEFRLAFERASSVLLAAQIEYRTLSASPFLQRMDTIQARRDLEAAREHFQRVRTAYAAGRIDGPAFDRARRAYEAARAYFSVNREDVIANKSGLALAQEAYARATLELEATEIRAPFAGRIFGWGTAVGMQVRAGQTLCNLADVSRILIDVDVVEAESGKVHRGDSAAISCMAYPAIQFPGIVRTISPVVDVRTRMMRVTVELCGEQPESDAHQSLLCPGMFASVLIETQRLARRLLVPREAVLMRDLRQLVFTMEHGRARWRYVETGEENRELVEIRSGIAEGDTVIVDGHHALAHGARVCIKE
jgi:RND family efflux transporter MFP subunit